MGDNRALVDPGTREAWRAWLDDHHDKEAEAWVVVYKSGVREGALSLVEAQEEALCFGWVDGRSRSLDGSRYSLRFTPRRADSIWSVSNIRRVERLIAEGRMTPAGMEKVAAGHRSGQWEVALQSEQMDEIPADLERGLRRKKGALAGFRKLTEARKKQLYHWLLLAKSEEARQRRIETIVRQAAG